MTNDKALVERLRDESIVGMPMENEAADRIEAQAAEIEIAQKVILEQLKARKEQAAEIERLREALAQIARLRTDLSGDFSLGSKQSEIARAALGEME